MSYKQILNSLKNGLSCNLYLIHGEEEFLIEDVVNRIKKIFLSSIEKNQEQSIEVITGDEFAPERLNEAVRTPSLFSRSKLVIVEPNYSRAKDKLNEVLPFISELYDDFYLVFVVKGKVDGRTKFYKHFRESSSAGEFFIKRLYKNQFLPWIKKRAELMGIKIKTQAARLLIDITGYDLRQLNNELYKLKTYMGEEKEEIDEKTVKNVSSHLKAFPQNLIFDLVDALGERRKGQVLEYIAEAVQDGQNPITILYMIIRQLRLIYWVKKLKQEGIKTEKIQKEIQQHPFVIKKCLDQGKNFSIPELRNAMEYAASIEYKIKTGQIDDRLAIEILSTNLVDGISSKELSVK